MEEIKNAFKNALNGERAHLSPVKALEGLTPEVAGKLIHNSPYTIWQLIKHVSFWHDYFLDYLSENKLPRVEKSGDGWVQNPAPANDHEFSETLDTLLNNIEKTKTMIKDIDRLNYPERYENAWNVYQAMASHISYHLGEIVLLRRMAGDYPPPSGGYVW